MRSHPPLQLRRLTLLPLLLAIAVARAVALAAAGPDSPLERVEAALARLPPPGPAGPAGRPAADQLHATLLEEKRSGRWFAALVSLEQQDPGRILARLASRRALEQLVEDREALVEVRAYTADGPGEDGLPGRRLTAPELAARERDPDPAPVFVTLSWRDAEAGKVVRCRVEFGLQTADLALARHLAYSRHRRLQDLGRRILQSRDNRGRIDARAQWDALQEAQGRGDLGMDPLPARPASGTNLFVALEYAIDAEGNFQRVVHAYRERDVVREILQGQARIRLQRPDGRAVQAAAFQRDPFQGRLTRMEHPLLGRDALELRVEGGPESEPARWNILEFGEPAVLQELAIARFGLISAHLDQRRKQLALKKTNLDIVFEPVFAGLNIGGGIAGVPFPIGAAARLGYNAIAGPRFLPEVPTAAEMRELFLFLAARRQDPDLRHRPDELLTARDLARLKERFSQLTDQQVRETMERLGEDDLRAMLRLARLAGYDAKYSLFVNILGGAAKVSGVSESGLMKEIFNSIYFSPNGDININYILLVLMGQEMMTPQSGVSLESLVQGDGPAEAWLQYLGISFDVRALLNSLSRLRYRNLADKELRMPFPYAARMNDIAAYEFRIFGYPLLIYYKRGLLKSDLAAYENDYAYGLIGTRVVEHFPTRESMEAEIRAGRMVPLGYVKVSDGRGGVRDSNLAVFAHRIPAGRNQGKTAIILYGLKAFSDYSAVIERELARFREFERGLQEGMVIEQLVEAEDADRLASDAFEPRIHRGEEALRDRFETLLGSLTEWRHHRRRAALGLPASPAETARLAALREELARRGVAASESGEDPLLAVDPDFSSVRHVSRVEGRRRVIQVTAVSSLARVEQALARARAGQALETLHRQALGEGAEGVAFVNALVERDGRRELGPLIRGPGGVVDGFGLRRSPAALAPLFAHFDSLPVAERARLEQQRWASWVTEFDADGDGRPERVAVTLEFPPGTLRRERRNPLTGEEEVQVRRDGRLVETITDRRITELEVSEDGTELASRTFLNTGSRTQPGRGVLVERTQTLQVWPTGNDTGPDLYAPRIRKLRHHAVTGEWTRETYGLFPFPVEVAGERFVSVNRYDDYGRLVSTVTRENALEPSRDDVVIPPAVLAPAPGRERFTEAPASPAPGPDGRWILERQDAVTGQRWRRTVNTRHFGRVEREETGDILDGKAAFPQQSENVYEDDFHHGLVPRRSVTRAADGRTLAETTVLEFDPGRRSMTGVQRDHTGAVRTNFWDTRWERPVRVDTALRRTVTEYLAGGFELRGTTTDRENGEEIQRFAGQWDTRQQAWVVRRETWYRPGIPLRTEELVFSPAGRPVLARPGGQLEVRSHYDEAGFASSNVVWTARAGADAFDQRVRVEDEFRWVDGRRESRVRTLLEGQPHDTYRTVTDVEGRTIVEQQRRLPGLDLETRVTFDVGSERVREGQEFQNGRLRQRRVALAEDRMPDGTPVLRFHVIPGWGLSSTQFFRLADPLGRVLETVSENGDRTRGTEWFAGSALPRVTETSDRQGTLRERRTLTPGSSPADGLPLDLLTRQLSGYNGVLYGMGTNALLRGTDLPVYTEGAGERVYFNLGAVPPAPHYAVDSSARGGVSLILGGRLVDHVVRVARVIPPDTGSAAASGESFLTVEEIDLRPLFRHDRVRQQFDRAGRLVELERVQIANPGAAGYAEDRLFAAEPVGGSRQRVVYRHAPGWIVEQPGSTGGGPLWSFTTNPPPAGSRAFPVNPAPWREVVTGADTSVAPLSAATGRLVRRAGNRRELAGNPHFPGVDGWWTAWSVQEIGPKGAEIFRTEEILDLWGRPVVQQVIKQGSHGDPVSKIAYQLGSLGAEWLPAAPGPLLASNVLAATGGDLSRSDFLCFTLRANGAARPVLRFDDGRPTPVRVGEDVSSGRADLDFWPLSPALTEWRPDPSLPDQASTVSSLPGLPPGEELFVINVPELARRGLRVHAIRAITLAFDGPPPGPGAAMTPLRRLERGGPPVPLRQWAGTDRDSADNSRGFHRVTQTPVGRSARDDFADLDVRTVLERGGRPVVITQPDSERSPFPSLVVVDASEPGSPKPLYQLSSEDGHYLQRFEVVNLGDAAQVYSVIHGFELPRYEVFDSRSLAQELAPGFMAYGYDYHARVSLTHGAGWIGRPAAVLRNRIAANCFNYGGERLLERLLGIQPEGATVSRFDYRSLHQDRRQAAAIQRLPTLAELLLPSSPVPWSAAVPPPGADPGPALDRARLRLALLQQHVRPFGTNQTRTVSGTYLIPTSPGTVAERYIDTVAEARIVSLAVRAGETGVAREILDFYREKSDAGRVAVHESYDALTGTAMSLKLAFTRPVYARQTAAAQIAVAEAALDLALATGDQRMQAFADNLVRRLLEDFRPPQSLGATAGPNPIRGISELPYLRAQQILALELWPEAPRYLIESNARALSLLERMADAPHPGTESGVREALPAAVAEQRAWLQDHVRPLVEASGVVPAGFFEVQDVYGGLRPGTAPVLAPERWTSPAAWLAWLEVSGTLGVAPPAARGLLTNLARAHGVTVNGVWGLDWSVPVLRPEAVSPELTARFARVAGELGDTAAAAFARTQLARLATNGSFPAIWTALPPGRPLKTEQGTAIYPRPGFAGWPSTLAVQRELLPAAPPRPASSPTAQDEEARWSPPGTDLAVFVAITASFYLAVLAVAVLWWHFRRLRRPVTDPFLNESLVPEPVMQRAEERWATRVLGLQTPAGAPSTRFSNATVEQNFLMQLRAIYKILLEWRRRENNWDENDPRLATDSSDPWLNGLDEFASLTGLYMRYVIKAGAKDGFDRDDPLAGHEDSNHIWSRLVMYHAEHYWAFLTLLRSYDNIVIDANRGGVRADLHRQLAVLGIRERQEPFDARQLFNYPANPWAMDLLLVQKPGVTLHQVMEVASIRLDIPMDHLRAVVGAYQEWKRRESPYPIHPFLIEFAKIFPHFTLMGLGSLVWYNQTNADSPIVPYLGALLSSLALDPASLLWAGPLLASVLCAALARFTRTYRFEDSLLQRDRPSLILDATVTMIIKKSQVRRPAGDLEPPTANAEHPQMSRPPMRTGWLWNPGVFEQAGWAARSVGWSLLAWTLFRIETPSFATFLVVKGILAMLAVTEVLGTVIPLAMTWVSKFIQDFSAARPAARFPAFLNRLNLTATRPASPSWLSVRYHLRPSVPTGDFWSMTQAVVFYFGLNAAFFAIGAFLCQQILSLWFTETYLTASNTKLLLGGLIFWNTMYLLRYGLFLLATSVASAFATFPLRALAALVAVGLLGLAALRPDASWSPAQLPPLAWSLAAVGVVLVLGEPRLLAWWRRRSPVVPPPSAAPPPAPAPATRTVLGIVYMSGDDLSFHKLTPALLMSRWRLLRDKLGSTGLGLLHELADTVDDPSLEGFFGELYQLERRHDVTLWHPQQLCLPGEPTALDPSLGLNLPVESAGQRARLLTTWQIRRWLVTMMSTAGHSQDTAINLVDIALRLEREGLAPRTVFYLIQNKYDNADHNRPVQLRYTDGELGQRDKLARLLRAVAPGARAWSLQDWTPFGFKSAGMTGMDLVHEEALRLGTMVVLDRNATVNNLDAFMEDVRVALADPDLIIVIPGRGTTNTLTDVGQGSQLIEEGHRSFLKGVMAFLGGRASEGVGTGWGNLLSVSYGRVQRAMMHPLTPKMPLTSRMQRGSSFAVRTEGLIGFTPHAVGISEDTWAVSQASHNVTALGGHVKYRLSSALWHKIRETWSHSEWLAAFPRWSGGYLQMMHDPIMQQINDFGPASVFAKEVRSNSGRNFLSAPFALLNSLLLPLAIILDLTPFVQILMLLWNFGFVMNQVLTLHGLNTYLEAAGFHLRPAVAGAAAGALSGLLIPGLRPFAPALTLLGSLYGGFLVGFNRWVVTRLRDIILFGPQLVLHALGQWLRQSIEFVASGAAATDAEGVNMAFRAQAGPREDRPLDRFPHFINLRTVVWVIGVPSLLLNLVALMNLDMFNVLLLLPSLLFSVSLVLGPFLMVPRPGRALGLLSFVPKSLGWLAASAFYTAVSLLVARGGWMQGLGLAAGLTALALVVLRGARFAGFRWRWARLESRLAAEVRRAGVPPPEAGRVTANLVAAGHDTDRARVILDKASVPGPAQAPIVDFLARRIVPFLQKPARDLPRTGRARSDFARSLVLALLVLFWFFIVPVPGLFVFSAGAYQTSVSLGSIVAAMSAALAFVLVGFVLGRFVQWFDRHGRGSRGLNLRARAAFAELQSAVGTRGGLTAEETSRLFALFTDLKTYVDQRSDAYAWNTLLQTERDLARARSRPR